MFRKSAYLFFVNMANRVLNYFLKIILRIVLGATDYGIIAVVLPVQNMLLTVTSYAVSPTVSRSVSRDGAMGKKDTAYPLYFLIIGGILAIVGFFAAPLFASFLSEEFGNDVVTPLRIMFLVLPVGVLFSIFTGIYFGKGRARVAAYGLFIVQVATLIAACVLGMWGGMVGVACAFMAAYAVGAVYMGLRWYRTFRPSMEASWDKGKEMLRFSLPMLLTSLAIVTIFQLDIIVLGRYYTTEETAIYGLVMPTSRLVPSLAVALSTMLLPKLSSLSHTESVESMMSTVKRAFDVGFVASLPFTLLIFAFSDEVLYVLFESGSASVALKILSVGMLFYSMYYLLSSAAQGMGNPRTPMQIIVACAGLDIILCFALIPRYGITGAAISTSSTMVFAFILICAHLRIRYLPALANILSAIPLLAFEMVFGIVGTKATTFVVYAAVGTVYLLVYAQINGLIRIFRDE